MTYFMCVCVFVVCLLSPRLSSRVSCVGAHPQEKEEEKRRLGRNNVPEQEERELHGMEATFEVVKSLCGRGGGEGELGELGKLRGKLYKKYYKQTTLRTRETRVEKKAKG